MPDDLVALQHILTRVLILVDDLARLEMVRTLRRDCNQRAG
jgi:hypothetical protein